MSRAGALRLLCGLAILLVGGCASAPERTAHEVAADDYLLPFEPGVPRLCVQPGPGPWSHQGSDAYAVDFAMPEGTVVLAARGGRVVDLTEHFDRGGAARENARYANHVDVLHSDQTLGRYLHLQVEGVLVEIGERVERGQPIALSGSTGWSSMPHLHFQVDALDPESGRWQSIPIRFLDLPGDGRPRMLASYRSGNQPRSTGVASAAARAPSTRPNAPVHSGAAPPRASR